MPDYIWENFGLIEWIFCLELIVLLTAAFFYQIAKIIARTDRHDPLVRFYRVFWLSFQSSVTSFADIEFNHAQAAALAAGYGNEVNSLDAPNLGDLSDAAAPVQSEMSQQMNAPAPAARGAPAAKGPQVEQQISATFDAVINPLQVRDVIIGFRGGNVMIDVQCASEDGHANGVIIDLIAPRIGVPPYQITLLRGHYKVLKSFRVQQIDQTALNMRLQRLG